MANPDDLQAVVHKFRTASITCSGKRVWANQDQPVHVRVPLRFLFGFKKLLTNWGYNSKAIRVDDVALTLKIGAETILSTTCSGNNLAITWLSEEWKNWGYLHNDDDYKALCEKCQKSLEAVGDKGKGKGKPLAK